MENQYFAARPAKETSGVLLSKATNWFNYLNSNGYLNKLREMWAAYHGAYYKGFSDGHKISFSGEQGEIANLPINHLRNIAQHILVMITSNRPAMQARSTNTDYKSLVQTKLAEGLLDYYLREKRLERYLKTAVEYAVVLGSGFIKMEWNSTTGEIYDYNEDTKTPIYEGDIQFQNLSPFDVVVDSSKETVDQLDWAMCRSFKNKYDLSAKYPEFKNQIEAMTTKDQLYLFNFDTMYREQTDDIPIYEFYHKRTESMPDGRYMLFLDQDLVLVDAPMPYRDVPVYRISPADIIGTPYGYTPMFDILPIQDGINALYSTILSNQNAFGIQNIWVPRGSDVAINQLAGGLNVIESNQKPEPLQLTNTPAEVFKFLEMLESSAETISGVSSVTRGNPEASLKSGAALALVQSMTLQFISGLQQSYIQLVEDVGTGMVNMLKDFAAVPRVAAIVGQNNRTFMKEFSGDDLSLVNRVIVDVGNPLSKTTAGRVQMAENMLQYGLIDNAKQYITLINTGNLDVLTEVDQTQLLLVKSENEKLVAGESQIALAVDNHPEHINGHKAVLADPDLRKDPDLVARTLEHIQQHINLMRTTDPDLLQIIKVPPLAPPPQAAPPAPPQQGAAPMEQTGMQMPANLPNVPTPPAPFEQLPTNPAQLPQ